MLVIGSRNGATPNTKDQQMKTTRNYQPATDLELIASAKMNAREDYSAALEADEVDLHDCSAAAAGCAHMRVLTDMHGCRDLAKVGAEQLIDNAPRMTLFVAAYVSEWNRARGITA